MMYRIAIKTLGCKLNFSESATLERRLMEMGHSFVPFDSEADLYIINTCAVTEQAGRKCRYYVHGIRKWHPEARIVLMGCYSALRAEQLRQELGADMVLGSNTKFLLPEKLPLLMQGKPYVFDMMEERQDRFYPAYSLREERTRSFLKVQDGCNYFCSYCTVPLARGRFRSCDMPLVLEAVRDILAHDIREIVLTGVNIGAYKGGGGEDFADLLEAISNVEGLQRLRISSLEPDLLSERIIRMVAERPNIMPHFHLPLQSGCDRVLERMKRRYRRDLYAEKVLRVRTLLPNAFVAADVIAGFPGETDEDFAETIGFIQSLPVAYLHVFPYSRRPGTPAFSMPCQVPPQVKLERVRALMSLSNKKRREFHHSCEGSVARVLVESRLAGGIGCGFSENYIKVKIPCTENEINTIQTVRLSPDDADGFMKGEVLHD